METADARAGSAQRRQPRHPRPARRPREDASEAFNPLTTMPEAAPLVNRLHLTWKSVPAAKQAKLYAPSSTQLPHAGNNKAAELPRTGASSNKQILLPIEPPRKLSQTNPAAVVAFEQKYAAQDPLMRYVLHVIRTGSPVRRSEIPRGKHIQRRVRPEEDALYLVHCEAPPCGFRNVYWLTVADEGTVLRNGHDSPLEYFTLGSHGFTRFQGGQGVEFSDLAGWVDEKCAFDHMTNMKGLEHIQQMVFFFSWKRQAVQRRLHRVRERLASSLFTCHPTAGHLLMDVRDVCAEIEREAEREYVEVDTSYTLERLAHIHRERVRTAKAAVTNRVHSLCVAIDDATRDISRYKEGQGCSYAVIDREAFSKALRLSSLRERMFTFLRLVDCHVAEAVYQHVTLVVRDLRVRICGQPALVSDSSESVIVEERRGTLCRSDLAENTSRGLTARAQTCQRVNYAIQAQESDSLVVAAPGLYVMLEDGVNFEGDVNSATMRFAPAKVEVLELVHTILTAYCAAMDAVPRVLTDTRFQHVLAPFVPSVRREFAASLLKPSHLVLESYESELREMRRALDMHFRRLGILEQGHLRCVRAIKVAEMESTVEMTRRDSTTELGGDEEEDVQLPQLPDLSNSAAAYELAQKTWNRFVQYGKSAAPMLQVGYLLLDQCSFVDRLRSHVSKRVAAMDDALPFIYQQFLTSLLEDVDGRIDKVTKIPTNLAEANTWLAQVTAMMPTHPFRQRLDTKIANLARLRVLIKERGLAALEPETQDSIRKLELTWESVIETLFMCLARVEERGSEHRRSVHDVISKVDEYISVHLQLMIKTFKELPSGCEGEDEESHVEGSVSNAADTSRKEDLVQQLEDLVAVDLERKNVVQQFEEYDREHRAMTDTPPPAQQREWTSSLSSSSSEKLSAVSLTDKLPSELLLLYIITSLELRQWFESWKKMQHKWLGSPLTGVHPGTMINRIKQFRRRLGYASSRLSRLSSILVQTLPLELSPPKSPRYQEEDRRECASFAKKDFELMRVFDSNIEEMFNCNRIFQAISGGALSDARWAAMNQLLHVQRGSDGAARGGSHLTLRMIKEKCRADEIEAFLDVCDECIVEAKLHVKLEQTRQRLARIEVRVEETNYSVRCEGVAEALAQLDEIAVDLKLCLFGQNPELQLCLEVRSDLERKVAVCEHILSYQTHWRLRCEATKLHEVDEFFSKQFGGGGGGGGDFALPRARKSPHKAGLKQEQSVWQAFLDASHAWSDRLRRLFFVGPQQSQMEQVKATQRSLLGRKSTVATVAHHRRLNTATKSMRCTLDGVMESFGGGFDFEANFAACERGMELVQSYLASLREKNPRLYCLDETSMLRLLLRDSDVQELHQSLALCFPRVHRFAISRAANRVGSTIEVFGKPESIQLGAPVRASKTAGTIVIVGLEGRLISADTMDKGAHFRLPVAKIGRVKFWFTRLEEEMASMVLTDLKRAFEWATRDFDSSEFAVYDSLLPQSIATASGLRFTFEMNRALRSDQHEQLHQQLRQLQVAVDGRLEALVATRRLDKATSSCPVRLENLILLSAMQSEVVRHVDHLVERGQHEDAAFFWSMQFQTRVFLEIMATPGSNVQPSPGKHSKVERNELFPSSTDFLKVPFSSHAGQSTSMSVCCQVAHLQMPLGHEFVGWGRIPVLSPFTQRCSYALISALRMHHTALVVPYNAQGAGAGPTSLLWGVSQMLWRPCIEFSCDPSAGTTTILHLGNLMSATLRLDGFLIVRHLLRLSAVLARALQEQMLQHFHRAARAGNLNPHHPQQQAVANSLVFPRHPAGSAYGASAIFVSLCSAEELGRSALVQSIRTQFRAVAVSRPAIKFIVECTLIADGFGTEQVRELNVAEAFEAIEAGEAGPICAFNVELLVARVVQEAQRLREHYRVVWDLNPRKPVLQSRQSTSESSAIGELEVRDGQCVFRRALSSAMEMLLTDASMERVNVLLTRVFPLASGGRLVTRSKGDEEAVAAAVAIYLESTYALPANCEQFELILELWRALQTFPAALVYGPPGSGKTSCITALHRALVALELSEQSQENEQVGRGGSQEKAQSALMQLVVLNPQLLSLDQFYSSVATACGAGDSSEATRWKPSSSSLKWVLVDGEIDGGILDRLLESDNRACSSASSLPSSSTLYRGPSASVISGDCPDPSDSPRLFFEVTSLVNLSPSALRRCWALHVPAHCITVASVIGAWRFRWENQLVFPRDSRGFEAMAVVFKTVDVLVSSVCVRFASEEAAPDRADAETTSTVGLTLGGLSLVHATHTALTLVSLCCLQNKALLQELAFLRLVELVAFAILWGFAGHLADPLKLKLENYTRAKSKEVSELKHLAELPHGLLDASHFEDVWDELQPRLATAFTIQVARGGSKSGAKPEATMESAFDPSSGQVLVVVPAATSLVRICTMLFHSSRSFVLVGPAASGKTSLLRWLLHRNREAEAAEMKVETSLDDRHAHGILDWTAVPAAWFRPLGQQDSGAGSRAKMRQETELFAGRSRHSFVFLDDLDASGGVADKIQLQFVRTMLDHRLGYSTRHGGFQRLEKHVGAAMRLDEAGPGQASVSPALARFMRHFVVLRAPTYTQNALLSLFRIKFQPHFQPDLSATERHLSAKGGMGGGGQHLPLQEVVLRASVDLAVEIAAFQQQQQQLGHTDHPCLALFNLHHVNMLLERTLVFAAGISSSKQVDSTQSSEGATLVQLGKAHQSWLSEVQNIFLSNCPTESVVGSQAAKAGGPAAEAGGDDMNKKLLALIRHVSEKYFSVAFRTSSEHHYPISVEALHFLVKLAEHHAQAPLLQPRLVQLRELLSEHMTTANGVSRRSSAQARGALSGANALTSATELASSVLLEIAAASALYSKSSGPYSSGKLTALEMKLLLSSSWSLTQVTHLVHALSQQQVVVSSTWRHRRLLPDRLLRFACDLHGYKVHTIDAPLQSSGDQDITSHHAQVLRLVLEAAGVRQERVALWVRERQVDQSPGLLDLIQELCLGTLPSLALLPGGEELRAELVLSCIQSRKQLEIVTEEELLAEFQQRLEQNFRLCFFQESDGESGEERVESTAPRSRFVRWMKTRPSCHWRRLDLTELELQRLAPEVASAALTSPALCGVLWDVQKIAKYVLLCQNVHLHVVRTALGAADPPSQLDYLLSFMVNVAVTYRAKLLCHQKKVGRLETALETLQFARDKVVPTLERVKRSLELQCSQTESELESFALQQEVGEQEAGGDGWELRSHYQELLMMNSETTLRLEEVSRFLAQWQHVAERVNHFFMKWTQELSHEKCKTEHEIMGVAIYGGAQRAYSHVTSLPVAKRNACLTLLGDLILETIAGDSSPGIERRLVEAAMDDEDAEDGNLGLVRLIWASRFSFLRNPEIYRTLRLADELCDRVPVFVDPSGVLQRFLVHMFSGHTLFSTFPGCGGAGEVESDHSSALKESMVISCDDVKLEFHLHDALRLGIPVLLINFRSTDPELLARLQPFLSHARLAHAPPRRPMLRELTMKYYEDQRRQKQRRTSTAGSAIEAMSSLAQTAATVGGGAALMTRRAVRAGKRKSVVLDPISVAAVSVDVAKTPDRRDTRAKSPANSASSGNGRNFQLYAITSTSVPPDVEHSLAAQLSYFALSVPDSTLETLFGEPPRAGKAQLSLLQELRVDQVELADCWMKMLETRGLLDQLLVRLQPPVVHDDSPFAARRSPQGVTIQRQEAYSELALQFAIEYQAEIIWSSRQRGLREKDAALAVAVKASAPTAVRLVGLARCMATMSSALNIGTRTFPFYLQSARYLESAAAQQLAVQGGNATELSAHGLAALVTRISSGFVSDSHRQLFCFLESIQQQIQATRSPKGGGQEWPAWNEALVWLVTSCVRRGRPHESSSLELLDVDADMPGRRNSLTWPGDAGTSLVERLRRRVQLCAYLFNGWRASGGSNNARGKLLKAPRPAVLHGSTAGDMQLPGSLTKTDENEAGNAENREFDVAKLQQKLDKLLADSETMWYEWKTSRVRLQLDVERLLSDLRYQDTWTPTCTASERGSALVPSAISVISLDELTSRYKADDAQSPDDITSRRQALLPLLLAKTFFPSSFSQALAQYLKLYGSHARTLETRFERRGIDSPGDDTSSSCDESWTAWASPASLVVDVAPPRGKHSRTHLPRALIMCMPDERSSLELSLSAWGIAVFVEDNVALREELIALITAKHKFVLELLDAKQAEAALALMSQLINEHALLSVPEWYLLASFTVATAVENGKLAVMDRIAVFSPSSLLLLDFFDRDRDHGRTAEQVVRRKLVEECGASDSVASALTRAVLTKHDRNQGAESSKVRDMKDLVLHLSSLEEVATGVAERECLTRTLLRLVTNDHGRDVSTCSRSDAGSVATLSSELLSDLLSVGASSLATLTDHHEDEWLPRQSTSAGTASCERLCACLCQIGDLLESLREAASTLPSDGMALFFPWQSLAIELANQFAAFKAIQTHLAAVWPTVARSPASNHQQQQQQQQQLSSLARGFVPLEWTESFFAGTAWPSGASGTVSVAQISLLLACRVGVLVRCLRGDRAWALNLAVVSDAGSFLQRLRTYAAGQLDVSASSFTLVLELDSSSDIIAETSTSTNEEEKKKEKEKKTVLSIADKLGAMRGKGKRETGWHGAVLHHCDGGVESWGIRVEGLVLLVQQASSTKLHPLPMCRIMCQPRVDSRVAVETPLVLLPSLSPYQAAPTIRNGSDRVRLALGRSIHSVVSMADSETTQFAVGVPVFPDDDTD
ncbi:hypothetical protein PHYPSEUDO_013513 [Phytophthora pseudosyringae]|uniref:Dynein heavy chain n=1 Tax=Phytophthora pseudosyringae TaxID=221518 RepID=A0A8T1WIF3_9STRA|nr:hypothetical protein PHYPSEUDO_013513 [Phytophthora pseudosyringae]